MSINQMKYLIFLTIFLFINSLIAQPIIDLDHPERKGYDPKVASYKLKGNMKKLRLQHGNSIPEIKEKLANGVRKKNLYKELFRPANVEREQWDWELNEKGQVLIDPNLYHYYYDKNDYMIKKERKVYAGVVSSYETYEYNDDYTKLDYKAYGHSRGEGIVVQMSEIVELQKDGSVKSKSAYSYLESKTSRENVISANRKMATNLYNDNGKLWKFQYKFDENEETIEMITFQDERDDPSNIRRFNYNDDGLLTSSTLEDIDYKYSSKSKYTYNKRGFLIESNSEKTTASTVSTNKATYDYLFDKTGNWILKFEYRNEELYEVVLREIEYWK